VWIVNRGHCSVRLMSKLVGNTNIVIRASKLERRRRSSERSRESIDRHSYFRNVAEARYVLRKIFRIIEEQAKPAEIDSLARQALIQIYGSPRSALRVKEIAARLDITPAFASSLVKSLVQRRYAVRNHSEKDRREIWVEITEAGKRMLHDLDDRVQIHVDYFNRQLTSEQREAALAILMFYVGVSLVD
jgi:DNA-binding MarR family transcriptional regulator